MENKTFYIIGAGAIGKVLAVFLKRSGKNAILIRGSVDSEPAVTSVIKVELADKSTVESEVQLMTLDNVNEFTGTVVITTKSFGNQVLAAKLKPKIGSSPVILMQNGLGVEQPFIDEAFNEIYRCVLFATSQPIGHEIFRFQPVSPSAIGIIKSISQHLTEIVTGLRNDNFPFKAEENIQVIIWKKVISNCVFNSVCPLLDIDNGIFHRNEQALNIAKRVIKECVTIAVEEGVILKEEEVIDNLLKISRASNGQLISTLVDIKNHRQTEIDTFNFAIARIAKKFNKESMVTETKLLGELTKLKSETNQH